MPRKKEFVSYTIYALNQKEVDRLLGACANMADHIMILLSIRLGLRREDIVKIQINNIDLENALITYHEQKKKRDRTVPLEPDVVQELRRYLNTLSKKHTAKGYLLPFTDGSSAWQHLQDLCLVAGIPIPPGRTGRPFHSLRGTCVKLRQAQGWTVNQVAALIGDEISTVELHYLKTSPSELAALMNGGSV